MPKPVELLSFNCSKSIRVCRGTHSGFNAIDKKTKLTYHHPYGVVVERQVRDQVEVGFVPINTVAAFTPKTPEDLLEALGVEKPKPPAKPKKPKKVKEPKAAE